MKDEEISPEIEEAVEQIRDLERVIILNKEQHEEESQAWLKEKQKMKDANSELWIQNAKLIEVIDKERKEKKELEDRINELTKFCKEYEAEEKKQAEEKKELKKQNIFLETLLSISHCEEWDSDSIHNDIVDGVDECGDKTKYPKGFAKWFANRFGIKKEEVTE